MAALYTIELWDHELGTDGDWSGELARQFLDGPNEHLGFHAIGQAIRTMRNHAWDNPSMYVTRENPE